MTTSTTNANLNTNGNSGPALTSDDLEEVLLELNRFEKSPTQNIPDLLERYLVFVAKTGSASFPWTKVKALFRAKLENVIVDFSNLSPTENIPSVPNVDVFNFGAIRNKVFEQLDAFAGIPFTVQRLAELLTTPRRHYKRTDKFMRALEKNMLIVSTMEARANNNNDSESRSNYLMNGDYLNGSLDNKGDNTEENDNKELEKSTEEQQQESQRSDQLVVDEIDSEMTEPSPALPVTESVPGPTSEIIDDEMVSQEEVPEEDKKQPKPVEDNVQPVAEKPEADPVQPEVPQEQVEKEEPKPTEDMVTDTPNDTRSEDTTEEASKPETEMETSPSKKAKLELSPEKSIENPTVDEKPVDTAEPSESVPKPDEENTTEVTEKPAEAEPEQKVEAAAEVTKESTDEKIPEQPESEPSKETEEETKES